MMEVEKSPATNTKSPNGGSIVKKKLSGATLGMRFMNRRVESKAKRTPVKPSDEETMDVCNDESDSNEPTSHLPQVATASEMYGLKSDLVGRRSFGGFHKSVSETWTCSLDAYTDGRAGERAKKEHVSDEELLRRYEEYIKGRGNLGGIDKAAAGPFGNLAEKVKNQRRRKNQSPQSGEKRKR